MQLKPKACGPSELDFLPADAGRLARFQSLLRVPTISWDVHNYDREQLLRLHEIIRQSERELGC